MNLRIFESREALVNAVARTIAQRIAAVDHAIIGISGGSTPKPLYELLATPRHAELLAAKAITWVLVDERWVPRSDPQSNAAMIERTLFSNALLARHRFLAFDTSLSDAGASAARFADEWHRLGIDALDVVLLGLGEDGHTASLFPGTPVLDVNDRIAAPVYVSRLEQWRVTLTMPTIRAAKLRVVLAPGESKRQVIAAAREGADLPVVRATSGEIETWWFTDRAAVPHEE